jgi:hypothetical protein
MAVATDYDAKVMRVQDLLEYIAKSPLSGSPNAHLRLWFRGHAKTDWKLEPGVYRQTFPFRRETERLELERQLTQDFRVQSAGILTREANEAELYFIQQHYRMPTRLLDWTGSPLAGLYFAAKEEESSDGVLFMMDAYELARSQNAENFRGVATSRHPTFQRALHRITRWEDSFQFPGFILPVRPDHFDRRMALQRSSFTFHVPDRPVLTKVENRTLVSLLIPHEAKGDLINDLFRLGIDEFSIFGDLESLSRRLRDAYNIP